VVQYISKLSFIRMHIAMGSQATFQLSSVANVSKLRSFWISRRDTICVRPSPTANGTVVSNSVSWPAAYLY
jgi:hypothetical protein